MTEALFQTLVDKWKKIQLCAFILDVYFSQKCSRQGQQDDSEGKGGRCQAQQPSSLQQERDPCEEETQFPTHTQQCEMGGDQLAYNLVGYFSYQGEESPSIRSGDREVKSAQSSVLKRRVLILLRKPYPCVQCAFLCTHAFFTVRKKDTRRRSHKRVGLSVDNSWNKTELRKCDLLFQTCLFYGVGDKPRPSSMLARALWPSCIPVLNFF